MKTQNARDKFFMSGTEGTGEYFVLLISALGRIGYRLLGFNEYRVRVEPVSKDVVEEMSMHFDQSCWKQPGVEGQQRWSRMVAGGQNLKSALTTAITSMVEVSDTFEINPDAKTWALELIVEAKEEFAQANEASTDVDDVAVDANAVCNEGEAVDNSVGYTAEELTAMTKPKLIAIAKACGLKTRKLNKASLVAAILEPESDENEDNDEIVTEE